MTTTGHRTGTLRFEFNVGVAAWSYLRDAENYGRSLGLEVEVHYSGWLVRHGWFVARGDEPELNKLKWYWDAIRDAVGEPL